MVAFVALIFVAVLTLVLVSVSVGVKFYETRRKKQVTEMLQTVAGPAVVETKILKDLEPAQPNGLQRLLRSWDLTQRATVLIQRAGLEWKPGKLFGMMGIGTIAGAVLAMAFGPQAVNRTVITLVGAAVGGAAPYFYVRRAGNKRLATMEAQLPEALDFLARSMRAGHAFSISLEMLGEELADPLGQEFRTLFNEQNLGAPIDVALRNLSARVPLLDVRFFASSVLLQRQTGGNLSEILARLAWLIRERFRLKGQVKASSAHGRMTAGVLAAVPLFTALALMTLSPHYLSDMAEEPEGRIMIGAAIAGQILGHLFIRKIVNIKV